MTFEEELKAIARLPLKTQPLGLAAFLSSLFQRHDVELIVVGGAAVQYYTDAEYKTGDLDAVLRGDTKEIIEEVMSGLGFRRASLYRHFEHPAFPFVVEFPPSPVAVGSRVLSKFNLLKMGPYSVHVVRVEDILMDRIVAGVEWRDSPSLNQAKLIYLKNKDRLDRAYLTDFAKKEGYLKTLRQVMKG